MTSPADTIQDVLSDYLPPFPTPRSGDDVRAALAAVATLKAQAAEMVRETRYAIDMQEAAEAARDEALAKIDRLTSRGIEDLKHSLAEAEAENERLREALRPFAEGSEAFDRSDDTYGEGPVFERITKDGHWKFTIADVRRARSALASVAVDGKKER